MRRSSTAFGDVPRLPLGDKLQRLAFLDPASVKAIETLVDLALAQVIEKASRVNVPPLILVSHHNP